MFYDSCYAYGMKTTSTQKVIKIGTSAGVTLPAKELKQQGIKPGDEVVVSIQKVEKPLQSIDADYEKFLGKYEQTLKNLANR